MPGNVLAPPAAGDSGAPVLRCRSRLSTLTAVDGGHEVVGGDRKLHLPGSRGSPGSATCGSELGVHVRSEIGAQPVGLLAGVRQRKLSAGRAARRGTPTGLQGQLGRRRRVRVGCPREVRARRRAGREAPGTPQCASGAASPSDEPSSDVQHRAHPAPPIPSPTTGRSPCRPRPSALRRVVPATGAGHNARHVDDARSPDVQPDVQPGVRPRRRPAAGRFLPHGRDAHRRGPSRP